ncbi:hypothetical protein [Reichenbachiella sp. 5M10]|uniref:hypothetical protein n=1 Tax=Reichenbachiella sp. 5M10 TaxID=1889772 RepID=UPI0013047843|nr:hypothetical protein [Reichenbachiella sp. 5M10]
MNRNKAKKTESVLGTNKRSSKVSNEELNSRMFLASSQCLGTRKGYLYAFGGDSL